MNAWFDLPQVGGTFESGLRNRTPLHLAYKIRTGLGSPPSRDGPDAVLLLKTLGVEYVAVHGPKSKEHYRDFRNPGKFEGLLERVYGDEVDAIYRLPYSSLAHLVRPAELPDRLPLGDQVQRAAAYVAAIDDASRPKLKSTWRDAGRLEIAGPVPSDMLLSVQVSYDPGWTASQDGRPLPVDSDVLGFIILRPQPAALTRIELDYRGTGEQRVMAVLSTAAWLAALGLCLPLRVLPRIPGM
jgi:hypothetical protein